MFAAVVLGAAQGARHSLEPDHLAAVSVLITGHRGARRSAWLGAVWGFGHTVSLVLMSIVLVVLGRALPDSADRAFNGLVGVVLVALGIRTLVTRPRPEQVRPVRTTLQALSVGALHGLAGTSALTAVVFAALPTALERLVYITLFGVGSIAGMAAVSALAGLWLGRVLQPRLLAGLGIAIGLFSIGIGAQLLLSTLGLL